MLKNLELPADQSNVQQDAARVTIAEAAIEAIEEKRPRLTTGKGDVDIYAQASLRVMAHYRHQIDTVMATLDDRESYQRLREIERDLIKVDLKTERDTIVRRRANQELDTETAAQF